MWCGVKPAFLKIEHDTALICLGALNSASTQVDKPGGILLCIKNPCAWGVVLVNAPLRGVQQERFTLPEGERWDAMILPSA